MATYDTEPGIAHALGNEARQQTTLMTPAQVRELAEALNSLEVEYDEVSIIAAITAWDIGRRHPAAPVRCFCGSTKARDNCHKHVGG